LTRSPINQHHAPPDPVERFDLGKHKLDPLACDAGDVSSFAEAFGAGHATFRMRTNVPA
jgi:hypothetical protein